MKKIYYLSILLGTLSSCANMFIATPLSVPLFAEKGEALIEAGASTNSFYINGAYAFSEKYAVFADGSMSYANFFPIADLGAVFSNGILDFEGVYAHRSIGAAVGRYNLLPFSPILRLEAFGGLQYADADCEMVKTQQMQAFVQGNFGIKRTHIEIGLATRLTPAYCRSRYQTFDYTTQNYGVNYNDYFAFHAELLACLRFGGEHVKGFVRYGLFQYGFSFDSLPDYYNSLLEDSPYSFFHLSTGLSVRF